MAKQIFIVLSFCLSVFFIASICPAQESVDEAWVIVDEFVPKTMKTVAVADNIEFAF